MAIRPRVCDSYAVRSVPVGWAEIYRIVRRVPRGRVTTYGAVGARPRGMAAISILDPMGAAVQQRLLEREGVAFDGRGRVDLERFGWAPRRRR